MKKLILAVLGCTLAATSTINAAGFQLSLTPDIALHPRSETINGVSIGVWNENPGGQWQAGFVNGATGDSYGLQSFVFLPTFYNYADNYKGVQWAFVNTATGTFVGWQAGLVNWTPGDVKGLQTGFFNRAANLKGVQWGTVNYCYSLEGLQLGLVNYAKRSIKGVQIGLVNVIAENEWLSDGDLAKAMIFVNWGF